MTFRYFKYAKQRFLIILYRIELAIVIAQKHLQTIVSTKI